MIYLYRLDTSAESGSRHSDKKHQADNNVLLLQVSQITLKDLQTFSDVFHGYILF